MWSVGPKSTGLVMETSSPSFWEQVRRGTDSKRKRNSLQFSSFPYPTRVVQGEMQWPQQKEHWKARSMAGCSMQS